MKKLLLGIVIGATVTAGIFYYINKKNEDDTKENLKALLSSFKDSKTTEQKLQEALNDPKAAMIISNALTIILSSNDEIYYYKGNDCSKILKTDFINIKDIITLEKQHTAAETLMVIIKKMPGSSLRNSMDLLDAITGAGISAGHFAEVIVTDKEKNCLQNYTKN